MTGSHAERLTALLRHAPAPPGQVLELFDSLPPVTVDELRGAWRGRELPTGHPLDGLLGPVGWHGKRFDGPEDNDPLVMEGPGGIYRLNPAFVPVRLVVRLHWLFRIPLLIRFARRALPLLAMRRPAARLRMVDYRGVSTATMIYDALPIHDHFRRVDEHTVLGVMDLRGCAPFFFVLERESGRR